MTLRTRSGAALVIALLVVIVVEFAIAGTLHLAMQERRIATNVVAAARVRIAAETAVRAAAAHWEPALDSLLQGQHLAVAGAFDTTSLQQRTTWQAVDAGLMLVTAEVAEPAPAFGRARAAALVQPPLLSAWLLPPATLTAGGTVQLLAGAQLVAAADPLCGLPQGTALIVADSASATIDAVATLTGAMLAQPFATTWLQRLQYIAAAAHSTVLRAGSSLSGDVAGVVIAPADLVVAAGAAVSGLLLVGGSLHVEAGATVTGTVLVVGDVVLAGSLAHAPCLADAALRAASLHRPRPHAPRPVLPAF